MRPITIRIRTAVYCTGASCSLLAVCTARFFFFPPGFGFLIVTLLVGQVVSTSVDSSISKPRPSILRPAYEYTLAGELKKRQSNKSHVRISRGTTHDLTICQEPDD